MRLKECKKHSLEGFDGRTIYEDYKDEKIFKPKHVYY